MKTRSLLVTAGIGLALLALTVVGAAGPLNFGTKSAAPPPPPPSTPRVAAEGRVTVRDGADVRVGTEIAGKLVHLDVREGDVVRAGQVIGAIDDRTLRDALDGVNARLAETDAEIRLAELTDSRRRELVARQVVAAEEADKSARDLDVTRARKLALEADGRRLKTEIDKCRITAPIGGTITERPTDAGEILEAGAPIVTIVDTGAARIEAEADESDAGSVAVGDAVAITADGWPGKSWRGHVESVPTWVEGRKFKSHDPARPTDTRVLDVKVAFDEPVPLKIGQTVELTITPAARAD